MKVSNRDLFVTSATKTQYKDISPLIEQDVLDSEFKRRERAALKAKGIYHRLGQTAIVLVALSAILTLAQALVLPKLFTSIGLNYAAVSLAFAGLALQCFIIFTKQKKKWLLNRYAAELIRSLRFQSFGLAHNAKDTTDLKKLVNEFGNRRLANLENDLNAGVAILSEFTPRKVLEALPEFSQKPKNRAIADTARQAYDELRVDYQRNFARSKINAFKSRRRIFNSTQDMIYLAAAIFAFISLGTKVFMQGATDFPTGWIDFTAVTLFILGSTEAIMDNALLEEQSQARYEQYVRDMDEVIHSGQSDGSFPDRVANMERVCLGELGEFCRAAERISYRF